MQDTINIKRRRLTAEVQTLNQFISDTQDMIKHDPYPQDIPSLTTQLINARADLAQAVDQLAQIGKEMKRGKTVYQYRGLETKSITEAIANLQDMQREGWKLHGIVTLGYVRKKA